MNSGKRVLFLSWKPLEAVLWFPILAPAENHDSFPVLDMGYAVQEIFKAVIKPEILLPNHMGSTFKQCSRNQNET